MGFLNEQNKQKAIDHCMTLIKQLKMIRQGSIGLSEEGESELAQRAMAHIDAFGTLDITRIAEIVDEVRAENVVNRDDMPHASDPQLKNITSIEAARGLSVNQLKMLTNDISLRSGLNQRFNERYQWLVASNIHETKPVESEPAAPVVLSPEQQKRQEITQRLEAVYAKIDKAGGPDWQQKTIQFRAWLKNKVKELISEKRGIGFIEKHIDEAIRDQENGSIR